MDYNSIVTSELPRILEDIVASIDKYSEYYKIEDLKIEIEDTDIYDIGTYVASGSTCEFLINVNYKVTGEDEYRSFMLTVPRLLNGIFVIKGKYKLLSRYLSEDYECRRISDSFKISWDFMYNIVDGVFVYKAPDQEEVVHLTFEELSEKYPDALELNEHQSYKLKILLNLDYVPTELTAELVNRFKEIDDNPRDVIHKKINSIESILLNFLRHNKYDLVKEMNFNFYQKGTISPFPLQKAINSVFNNQSGESLNSTIGSTNVNPLSFDSTNQKIIIDNSSYAANAPGNYDSTMADIIDPIVTPDNANINRINMLTNSVSVKAGFLEIKCFAKDFTPITVDYLQYLGSRVLVSEEVESYEGKVVASKDSYKVKYNRRTIQSKDYDFIECQPDDRLSLLARYIPMINQVDSVRGSMAAKMITQAVPLCTPDAPRVQSGHESDTELSTTDVKFESTAEGKVLEVTPTKVVVDVNGIPKEFQVPKPAVGIYDITTVFSPKVKVGDIVTKGTTLITHDVSKTGVTRLGVNALACMRPYRGYNYEDGIVISESFAKRLSHFSIIDLTYVVNDRTTIESILPVGTYVKSKDTLITAQVTKLKRKSTQQLSELLIDAENPLVKYNNLVVPNNITKGVITDVKIEYNKDLVNEKTESVIRKFQSIKSEIPAEIPDSYQVKLQDDIVLDNSAAIIKIRLITFNPATVGTKLANLYGSKGLVSLILPDEEMDRTEDGRLIDIILNSDAVIARKNFAQIPVMDLAKIADVLKDRCKTLSITEAKELLAKYQLYNYSSLSDEELEVALNSDEKFNYITGSISKISSAQVLEWMRELGIDELTRIVDGKTKRKVKNPVYVGNMYMIKLYQLPEHYNKVHTSYSEEDPILGSGLYREGEGQSIGALETYALMASDLEPLITDMRKEHQFETAESILLNLRLAGINLKKS